MSPVRAALIVCFLAAACRSASDGAGSGDSAVSAPIQVEFGTVARGDQSGFQGPQQLVIRTREGWQAAWARHASNRLPPPPCPEIDFSRDMVVVLALGDRPSAGFGLEVESVAKDGAFLRIRARERAPAKGTAQAAVVSRPFHILRVPRSPGPVEIAIEQLRTLGY